VLLREGTLLRDGVRLQEGAWGAAPTGLGPGSDDRRRVRGMSSCSAP